MKRIAAILLLLCMVFLLCACPDGDPTPTPGGDEKCPTCGKDPCECPGGTCPDCGKNPCECTKPSTGNDATVLPDDTDHSVIFGAGAALDETGDSIADRSFVMTEKTYDESSAISKFATRFFAKKCYNITNPL